jgi:hypothetical protein
LRKISKQKTKKNEKYEPIYEFDRDCGFLCRDLLKVPHFFYAKKLIMILGGLIDLIV